MSEAELMADLEYLKVCANLADKPYDQAAYVSVSKLRDAVAEIERLRASPRPPAPAAPVDGERQWLAEVMDGHADDEHNFAYDAERSNREPPVDPVHIAHAKRLEAGYRFAAQLLRQPAPAPTPAPTGAEERERLAAWCDEAAVYRERFWGRGEVVDNFKTIAALLRAPAGEWRVPVTRTEQTLMGMKVVISPTVPDDEVWINSAGHRYVMKVRDDAAAPTQEPTDATH